MIVNQDNRVDIGKTASRSCSSPGCFFIECTCDRLLCGKDDGMDEVLTEQSVLLFYGL